MKSVICRDCWMKSFFKICFTFVFHLEKEMKTANNKVIMMMMPVKNLTNEKSSKTKKLIRSAHHPCRMSSASAWVQPSCDEELQLKLTGKKNIWCHSQQPHQNYTCKKRSVNPCPLPLWQSGRPRMLVPSMEWPSLSTHQQ